MKNTKFMYQFPTNLFEKRFVFEGGPNKAPAGEVVAPEMKADRPLTPQEKVQLKAEDVAKTRSTGMIDLVEAAGGDKSPSPWEAKKDPIDQQIADLTSELYFPTGNVARTDKQTAALRDQIAKLEASKKSNTAVASNKPADKPKS